MPWAGSPGKGAWRKLPVRQAYPQICATGIPEATHEISPLPDSGLGRKKPRQRSRTPSAERLCTSELRTEYIQRGRGERRARGGWVEGAPRLIRARRSNPVNARTRRRKAAIPLSPPCSRSAPCPLCSREALRVLRASEARDSSGPSVLAKPSVFAVFHNFSLLSFPPYSHSSRLLDCYSLRRGWSMYLP